MRLLAITAWWFVAIALAGTWASVIPSVLAGFWAGMHTWRYLVST